MKCGAKIHPLLVSNKTTVLCHMHSPHSVIFCLVTNSLGDLHDSQDVEIDTLNNNNGLPG